MFLFIQIREKISAKECPKKCGCFCDGEHLWKCPDVFTSARKSAESLKVLEILQGTEVSACHVLSVFTFWTCHLIVKRLKITHSPTKAAYCVLTVHLKQDKKKSVSHLWRRTFKNILQINVFVCLFVFFYIFHDRINPPTLWTPCHLLEANCFCQAEEDLTPNQSSKRGQWTDGEKCTRGRILMI